jgi:hypothetical protein
MIVGFAAGALLRGAAGAAAMECTASTCCNVAIPKLPLATTQIDSKVCNQGTIPAEVDKLTMLKTLMLNGTQTEGNLPDMVPLLLKLPALTTLGLGVLTSGTIPPSIKGLVKLETLNFNFALTLSGTIPPSIGGLGKLANMNFKGTDLSGVLPASMGELMKLTMLNLVDTSLRGTIPAEIDKLTMLEALYLQGSKSEGNLPDMMSLLLKLTVLSAMGLGYGTSGSIPAEIGSLAALTWLSLANTKVEGMIPVILTPKETDASSVALTYLDLGGTNVEGPLPSVGLQGLKSCNLNAGYDSGMTRAYTTQNCTSTCHPGQYTCCGDKGPGSIRGASHPCSFGTSSNVCGNRYVNRLTRKRGRDGGGGAAR